MGEVGTGSRGLSLQKILLIQMTTRSYLFAVFLAIVAEVLILISIAPK